MACRPMHNLCPPACLLQWDSSVPVLAAFASCDRIWPSMARGRMAGRRHKGLRSCRTTHSLTQVSKRPAARATRLHGRPRVHCTTYDDWCGHALLGCNIADGYPRLDVDTSLQTVQPARPMLHHLLLRRVQAGTCNRSRRCGCGDLRSRHIPRGRGPACHRWPAYSCILGKIPTGILLHLPLSTHTVTVPGCGCTVAATQEGTPKKH